MKKNSLHLIRTSILVFFCSSFSLVSNAQSGATFKQWGEESISQIKTDFFQPGSGLYTEALSATPSFIWPGGIMLHALIAAGKTSEAENYSNAIQGNYWCTRNGIPGYVAYPDLSCNGGRFYDDNAWVAKASMELYKATNNVAYLNRAKAIIAFSMSGQNANGSIKFQEGDADGSTCICASAPTSVTNLMIYQATQTQQYLNDGLKIYNYIKSQGWKVGPGYCGYENAVTCQAAILLYQITGDGTYRNDAVELGLQMETFYIHWADHALYETGQWGGHDMTNAYVELYQMDGDINWLNIAAGYLKYLHDNCKDANGRYPENWNDLSGGNPMLLYQASAARGFAKMGTTAGGQSKYPDPVAVFADCNFTGYQDAGLWLGKYTTADLQYRGIQNNGISSVKVQSGYKVTLYASDNFTGTSLVLTADNSCLAGTALNDHVGSMIVETSTPIPVFFKDVDYTGRAVGLPHGNYTLAQMQQRGINNKDITSCTIPSGYVVTVYDGDNFTGASKVFTSTSNWLADWNDRISSLKVDNTNGLVSVFQDADYGGYGAGFSVGDYKLSDLTARGVADNGISSVKVSEGYKVILYFDDNFTGTSTTITANNNFIGSFNDQVTSFRVLPNGTPNISGVFFIQNRVSNLYMDVSGASTADGAAVMQGGFNGNTNQQFKLTDIGNGAYSVIAVHSGKGLDVAGVSTTEGGLIQQWPYGAGNTNQQFILVPTGDGYFKLIAEHDGMVAEVSTINNGEQLHQWENAGQLNSEWLLIPTNQTIGNGNGLLGNYFNGQNFETPAVTKTDAKIDMNWGAGSPDAKVNNDSFSARWTGQLLAKQTGDYTFYINSDNGRRLWINDQLIIDQWVDDCCKEYTGLITLTAGLKYNFKMEYFENLGGAEAHLY